MGDERIDLYHIIILKGKALSKVLSTTNLFSYYHHSLIGIWLFQSNGQNWPNHHNINPHNCRKRMASHKPCIYKESRIKDIDHTIKNEKKEVGMAIVNIIL